MHFLLFYDRIIKRRKKEERKKAMFQTSIGNAIIEVSHKEIEHPEKAVYYKHIHSHCEILLFVRGEAHYNIDGQIFKPSPYDLIFIPAATYHYLIPEENVTYENYVIGLDPSFIEESHYRKLFAPPLIISAHNDDQLMAFFTRLELYQKKYGAKDFELCAASLIRELCIYCSYHKEDLHSVHSGTHTHIDRIVSYIAKHLEEPLDADILARRFSFSRSYVQNLFSQNMHIGLKKYIMQKKIYAAHRDLLSGLSPSAVCEKYGFGDYSSFYRLYRKTFSSAPNKKI